MGETEHELVSYSSSTALFNTLPLCMPSSVGWYVANKMLRKLDTDRLGTLEPVCLGECHEVRDISGTKR